MAYCTYEDDVAQLTRQFTPRDAATGLEATKPSLTDCGGIVDQIAKEIDGHLRCRGRTVPIVDPEDMETLLPINANGAAAAILRSAFPVVEGIGGSGGAAAALEKKYQAGLQDIRDGLLDHDVTTGDSTARSGFHHWHHPLGYHRHHDGWGY